MLTKPVPYDLCVGDPISCWETVGSTPIYHSVLNVKTVVAAFNQEKALVGAFSVIVKTKCKTDGALHSTIGDIILQNTKIFTATWYERACYYCGLLYYSECYYWRYYSLVLLQFGRVCSAQCVVCISVLWLGGILAGVRWRAQLCKQQLHRPAPEVGLFCMKWETV